MNENQSETLLAPYRILDLADEKAMYCTKLLGDMGADVIKIERPGGDRARGIGPFRGDMSHKERSLYFSYVNTSKRGITLSLKTEEGHALFKRLVSTADIVVETNEPGYLEKLGLGWRVLSKINPGLIMESITNFGQTGPYKDYKSSDIVACALGGVMSVCGKPSTPPLKPYGGQAYYAASLFGAIAILLALCERSVSGIGQYIDISMHECVASVVEHVHVFYLYLNEVVRRTGYHWSRFAFCHLKCQDGYILVPIFVEWEGIIAWMDSEGMAGDLKEERWQRQELRQGEITSEEINHIVEVLERWTKTHTANEMIETAQAMRLPWAPIDAPDEVVENPQLKARGFFKAIGHPELGTSFTYPGAPYKLSQAQWPISRRAPLIGEHNKEVYQDELGLCAEELILLSEKGVI